MHQSTALGHVPQHSTSCSQHGNRLSTTHRHPIMVRCATLPPQQQQVDAPHSTDNSALVHDRLAQMQQRLERQCQPRMPYVPAPDAEGRAKQLTADISHKQHWSQLHNLWLDNAAEFSQFHLTATLCRLARLACRDGIAASDRPELFKFSGALLLAVRESVLQLDSRGLAQCLWAYAKLQSAAPHSSSSGDAAAATLSATLLQEGRFQQLQPSQLSQAAWAAATLQDMGMVLPVGWWAANEQRALQLMQYLKPSEAACCAWACTSGGRRMLAALAVALQGHVVQMSGVYRARELLQVMLALAAAQQPQHQQQVQSQQLQQAALFEGQAQSRSTAEQASSASWLAVCYSRLDQEAPCMSATEVSTALLALSRLGARNRPAANSSSNDGTPYHPLPLPLSTRLLRRAHDTLPNSSPRDLVTLAYALAKLQLNPGPWWWARVLPFSAAALHVCTPSMLAVLAWSMAKLDVQPGPGWTQELLQHTGFKIQGLGAQEATMLMTALGKWRACPDLWWWAAFEDATQHMMPYFTAAELAGLLSGMGSTGPPPQQQQQPPAVPGALWRAKPQHGQHQDAEAAAQQAAWQHARARWGAQHVGSAATDVQQHECVDYTPGGAWTSAMLVSAQRALSGAPAGDLGGILMGLAKLAISPSTAWMDVFEAAVLQALPAASLKEVAAVLWGLSVMRAQPSRALVQAADIRIMSLLRQGSRKRPAAGVRAAAAAATAAAALAAHAVPALTATAAHAAASGVPAFSVAHKSASTDAAHAATEARDALAAHAAVQRADAAAAPAAAAASVPPGPEPLQQWSGLLGTAAGQGATAGFVSSRPTAAVAAQLLWSVAWLPQPEGIAAWADDLLTAVMPSLQVASQQSLFVLLRSLAKLQHAPGCRQWVDVWWRAYAAHLQPARQLSSSPAGQQSSALTGSVGTFGGSMGMGGQHRAGQAGWQQGLGTSQLKKLQHSSDAEETCLQLTVMMWCFGRLHTQPSQQTGWLQTVAAVTQPLLHQLSAERFGLLLFQMAQLHVWLGEGWLQEAEAVLQQHRQHMPAQHVKLAVMNMQAMGCSAAGRQL